jgi:selenocysteine lyase/cysteine desulfurase
MRIYLDNAATSWPKPVAVVKAMKDFLIKHGGNPGRSGHERSIDAARTVLDTREAVAGLFGIDDLSRVIFTKNATEALNIALFGYLLPGDHLVTTSMEHNSVLRPTRELEMRGVELTIVQAGEDGLIDPQHISTAC